MICHVVIITYPSTALNNKQSLRANRSKAELATKSKNLMSFLKFLLLLIVFLTPLLNPIKSLGYEQTKVFFFIIFLTLGGFLWTIYSLRHPVKIAWSPIQKAATLFIAILFLTSILGVDRWNSFLGTQPYFQGAILYAYLYLFFLLISWSRISLEKWAYVLAGSSSLVGILAIHQWVLLNVFHQSIPSYAGRVVSSFGQPNFYSGFLLLTLPFFYLLLKRTQANPLIIIGFLINILAIILSESRIGYILLSLLIVLFLLWELPWKKLTIALCGLVLSASFIFALFFGAGFLEKEFIEVSKTNNPDTTQIGVEKRYYLWQVIGELIIKNPLLGYGLENIGVSFSNYFVINKHSIFEENLNLKPFMFGLKDLNVDRSHNYSLDLLMFSGILGLLSWLILVVMLFLKLGQKVNDRSKFVLLTSLLVYLVWIQFQNQSVIQLLYFWLLVGLIDSNTEVDKRLSM